MAGRRSSNELRQLLLDAGLRVLYRTGLRATASHVPMTAAIDELAHTHGIEVGMGSIFGRGRLWANVGEFQVELLRAAIEDGALDVPNDASMSLVHSELVDLSDRPYAERTAMMVELCRAAGLANRYQEHAGSKRRSWELLVGIWAIAMTADDARDELLPPLRGEVDRLNLMYQDMYAVALRKLGLRLKAPYTMRHLVTLASGLADGLGMHTALDPSLTEHAASFHDDQEWNLLGVGLVALAGEMLEDAAAA